MEKIMKIEDKRSHATAVLLILPVSAVSAIIYLLKTEVLLKEVLLVSIGGIIGGMAGAKILNKISHNCLHIGFGIILIITSVRMLIL